ncbi:methyl-accepting chemotaxis protein [Crocosphaera subtropica]|nr:HAMP domain-containing methyl-accepting chemotaxis protein [Crocosphaera subtropica]
MTTHQDFLSPSNNHEIIDLSSEKSFEETNNQTSNKSIRKVTKIIGNSLRSRLLMTVLPTVLVPLGVASLVGFKIIQQKAQSEILSQLQQNLIRSQDEAETFIKDNFTLTDLVAANPLVIDELRSINNDPETQKLSLVPIETLEKSFNETKLLKSNPAINTYLQQLVKTGKIAEVFITNSDGFNVAYSNPTSDFVQRDESWWQTAEKEGISVDDPEYDDSAKAVVVALAEAIKDPNTGDVLGVIKTGVLADRLNERLTDNVSSNLRETEEIQIISSQAGIPLNTVNQQGSDSEVQTIIGGDNLLTFIKEIVSLNNSESTINSEEIKNLEQQYNLFDLTFKTLENSDNKQKTLLAEFKQDGKIFNLSTIPGVDWVAVASINQSEIAMAGQELLIVFAITAIILGGLSVGLIILLARNLSNPLTNLTNKAQQVASGDLNVQAELAGTFEIKTLANSFNDLVLKVKTLLNQQELATEEQREQRENIENAIITLVDEIEGAADGDLTVRASLDSLELSTVADLFNLIIENLKDIATEVKQSTNKVSHSLETNEHSIRKLAEQSIQDVEEIQKTLTSIEQMSQSIEEVTNNAAHAAQSSEEAYQEVQKGSNAMETTVTSILTLKNTVNDTAQKMKHLGESSQRISQVVAIIEEIALKTNLLAINASVEARRAGEQGQGFTVVAEQVGALAEQSSNATKEIGQIIAAIQRETQEVATQMETGTTQVVDASRLVETTQAYLTKASQKSQEINQLMQSISQATISQSETSQIVTNLMQKVSQSSQDKASSSNQIAEAIHQTTEVAKDLESKVDQFRVN